MRSYWKMLQNLFLRNHLAIKPLSKWILLWWSFTKFIFLLSIWKPRWLPPLEFIIHAAFIENVKLEVHLSLYRSPGYSCRLWQFCLSCWGPLVYLFPKTSIIWLPNLLIMSTHMGFLLCPLKYTSLLLTHPHHFVTINNTSTFIFVCLLFW